MKIESYEQVWSLWRNCEGDLRRHLRQRFAGDDPEADDLAHDVLLRLHAGCCSGREIRSPRAYVKRVADNLLVDRWRAGRRSPLCGAEAREPAATEATEDPYRELTEYVLPLIGFLPPRYARPLILADLRNMKQEDIARELGLSLSGAKSRVQRARVLLRREVATCFYPPDADGCFELKESCTPLVALKKED